MGDDNTSTVARGGKTNTLSSRNIPIIFVPGVMGSRLMRPNGDNLWDPDNPSSMISLVTMSAGSAGKTLNADTPAEVMTQPSKKSGLQIVEQGKGWEGLAWDFYGNILRTLQKASWNGNTCNVYAYGYDWRQNNTVSGKGLLQFISKVLSKEKGAEKVIIVTHSMGGLVARSACKEDGSKVLGVVHVVQPAVGAVVAYRRFKTGARGDLGDGEYAFTKILGNTAEKYQKIGYGLRGPLQLLPTNAHPSSVYNPSHWLTADEPTKKRFHLPYTNIYDMYREKTGGVGLFEHSKDASIALFYNSNLTVAEKFHNNLGTWFHNPTYVIAVKGHETDSGTDLETKGKLFGGSEVVVNETLLGLSRRTYKDGDGTVPIGSQTVLKVPQSNQFLFENATAPSHADVFSSNLVNDKVIHFVRRIMLTA